MPIWHLTYSSESRHTLHTTEAGLLAGVHALVRTAREGLILFCIVDDHVHVVLERDEPGRVAPGLQRAIGATARVPLSSAHRTLVESRRHLEYLVNRYIVVQPEKHGLRCPAALWPGSCFLDLAGARRRPGLSLRLPEILPRFRLEPVFRTLGLPAAPLGRLTPEGLRRASATRIARAAAAATGIPSAARGGKLGVQARRAAAALCDEARLSSTDLARALGIHVNSARRLVRALPDPDLCDATHRRLALENRVILAKLELPGHTATAGSRP